MSQRTSLLSIENALQGVAAMLLSCLAYSLVDTLSKLLGTLGYQAIFITWGRLLTQSVLMLPFVVRWGGIKALRIRHPKLQLLRGISFMASGMFFVSGLHYLPLATMAAINFIAPFMITILSVFVLKEYVGHHRWLAIVGGFAGAIIIVRPGMEGFRPASLFGFAAAGCWSVGVITTRLVQRKDSILTTLACTALVGLAGASLLVPAVWKSVTWEAALCLIGTGVNYTLGQMLMIWALRKSGPSLLAPFAYSQIIWASLLGLAIWGEFPDLQTCIGAAVIISCGLYLWYREKSAAAHPRHHSTDTPRFSL